MEGLNWPPLQLALDGEVEDIVNFSGAFPFLVLEDLELARPQEDHLRRLFAGLVELKDMV